MIRRLRARGYEAVEDDNLAPWSASSDGIPLGAQVLSGKADALSRS